MALKILLADDSMTAQNMGKKILLDAGYDVVAVSNGAAAIKKIASDRPDIIILDVYMPGYTGLEVCERVKAAHETAHTPVLLTVGKMEPFKPEDANRVKADGVMVKPFEATDLIAVMQNFGKQGSGSANGRTSQDTSPRSGTYVDTVPIAPPEEVPHEDTVRLTTEQLRAFQDETYKDWAAPSEPVRPQVNTVAGIAIPAQVFDEVNHVITPSPISYGQKDDSAEKEQPEPFAASSVLEALNREDALEYLATATPQSVAEPDITLADATVVEAPSVPEVLLQPVQEETSAVLESAAQPFFSVQAADEQSAPSLELAVTSPAFVEPVFQELETGAPVADMPAFIDQLQEFEPNVAAPVDVVGEAVPELEINSPPELRAEQVVVAADPALITDPDDLAGFITKFGAPGGNEIDVGLVSDLPAEQFAAVTQPLSPLPEEVAAEIAAVLGTPLEPQAESSVEQTQTYTHVADEIGGTPSEAPAGLSDAMVAYVPGLDEFSAAIVQQPGHRISDTSAEEVGKLASIAFEQSTVELRPDVSEPMQVVAETPAPAVEETAAPEAALSAVAGIGAMSGTGYFTSPYEAEPEQVADSFDTPAVSVEAAPEAASPEETSLAEAVVYHASGDAELSEQLAAALSKTEAEQQAASAEQAAEVKDPGATDLRLSEAVARAIERLKPQLITEIIKELRK